MYLYDLIGKKVRVNNDGPESRSGRLLHVERDYLVLDTKEDGVVYYNLEHIKSVSELTGNHYRDWEDFWPRDPSFIRAFNFWDLLRSLINKKIQINRGGPDKVVGHFAELGPGFLVIEDKKDKIRVPIFHIKNVSVIQKKDKFFDQDRDKKDKSKRGKSSKDDRNKKDNSKRDKNSKDKRSNNGKSNNKSKNGKSKKGRKN